MTEPRFSGDARLSPVGGIAGPVKISLVRFTDSGRTYWHSHNGGQVLYVTEGEGRHQVRGGEVETISTGDSVVVAPGIEHWHGAARGTTMAHLAISGGVIHWLEEA